MIYAEICAETTTGYRLLWGQVAEWFRMSSVCFCDQMKWP